MIQGADLVSFSDDSNFLIIEKDESALQHKIWNVMKDFGT